MGNEVWLDEGVRGELMRIRGIGGGKLDGLDPCVGSLTLNVVLLMHCIHIFICGQMSVIDLDPIREYCILYLI